ncbi:MAG: lipid-A-disaccharide synthase [Calditerrivibrio sp.]|nr:lipid-A-disaccharide synthase [Calditerrivibrio sp.]
MKIFLVAGEESGDIHGANMIRHLKLMTDFSLYGTGGVNLKDLGQEQYLDISDMTIIGVGQIFSKIPFIINMFKVLKKKLLEVKPDLVVLIDYPGFNLKFAKFAKKNGFKVVYYITPQVWAWHYSRVNIIKMYVDKVYCILPFEEDIFRKEGIDALYVGNPIVDNIKFKHHSREDFFYHLGIKDDKKLVGLLPGSRKREIYDNMPIFMDCVVRFSDRYNFVIAKADSVKEDWLKEYNLEASSIKIVKNSSYDVMKYSDILWCCSGTASLEAAILGTPSIIVYKISTLTNFVLKYFIKPKWIGLPNIILKKTISPELLNQNFNINALFKTTEEILKVADSIREELRYFKTIFEGRNPSQNVAQDIYEHFIKISKI